MPSYDGAQHTQNALNGYLRETSSPRREGGGTLPPQSGGQAHRCGRDAWDRLGAGRALPPCPGPGGVWAAGWGGGAPWKSWAGWGHDEFSSQPREPDVLLGPAWGAQAGWCGLKPESTRCNVTQRMYREEERIAVRCVGTWPATCTHGAGHRPRRKPWRKRRLPEGQRRPESWVVTLVLLQESRDAGGENSARRPGELAAG